MNIGNRTNKVIKLTMKENIMGEVTTVVAKNHELTGNDCGDDSDDDTKNG